MICQSRSIHLLSTCAASWIVRALKKIYKKVKNRLLQKQKVSDRKLSRELGVSETSVRWILKIDLGFKSYKKIIEPSLSDDQKIKWKQFANWPRTTFRKEDTLIVFSDEKFFDIDGVYACRNERVSAINRADADEGEVVSCSNKISSRESDGVVGCLLQEYHTQGALGRRNC